MVYADLRFTGTFNVYCDSMFQEDRRISNPVKKVPADIVFYTQVKEKTMGVGIQRYLIV
jgi:hypothetical protein